MIFFQFYGRDTESMALIFATGIPDRSYFQAFFSYLRGTSLLSQNTGLQHCCTYPYVLLLTIVSFLT